jgi:hypothetical protein
MGKRELLIALGFVALAAIAYQMTAPAPRPGERGFSFSRVWNEARREMRGNPSQATINSSATLPAAADLSELRFESVRAGEMRLKFIGEMRQNIAYEMSVVSNGPDEATATEFAKRVKVTTDDLGSSLTMRMEYPPEHRQQVTMTVRLPARLGLSVSGANGIEVSNVAKANLEGITGDCAVTGISGALSGSHRNGSLKVDGAGSIKLNLQRSRATIQSVERGATLDVRDGEVRLVEVKGPIEIDEQRAEISVTRPDSPVRIGGTEGRIWLTDPRAESRVDVRRAEVEVQLSQAIPLTLLTTEDTLRLILTGPPHVMIDAVATSGKIQGGDFQLDVTSSEREQRVMHTFGASGAPRVSLRNTRSDIVIRKSDAAIVNRERK